MKLREVLLVIVAALVATSSTSAAAYDDGSDYFSFRDDRITESSGVVASSYRDGVYYTHNDSDSAPELFAVDDQGCTLTKYDLVGAGGAPLTPWRDPEDIARGPHGDDGSVLWIGDIGDNLHERADGIAVYRFTEPQANASPHRESDGCPTPDTETAAVTTYRLAYPDQPQDAETLLADPISGQLFVVTKAPTLHSFVYAAPLELDPSGVNVLELVGSIVFPPSTTYDRDPATELARTAGGSPQIGYDSTGRVWTVGGDIHPDRARVVIRTYTDAWEWELDEGVSLGEALTLGLPTQVPLRYERQGEAIAYTRDGGSLVTTCEDVGCTAHRYSG